MIDKFQIAVRELIDLEDVELLALSKSVKTRQYKKGEIFLKEGDHCNYIGFLNTGFFNFHYMKDGVQLVRGLQLRFQEHFLKQC